jgi:HEAT repeat protein
VLGELGDAEALPALIGALDDTIWHVRFAAVAALGHIGGVEARAAIMRMQDDENTRVRELAGKVLRKMRG